MLNKKLGNTCYLNSVLQALTYTRPLVNYLFSGDHSQNCTINGFCMLCQLEHLMKTVLLMDLNYHLPREILLNLNSMFNKIIFL